MAVTVIDPIRFQPTTIVWNTYVTALAPWAWLKLDDGPNTTTAVDASGNGRNGSYPNGTFGGGDTYPNFQTTAIVTGSTYAITCGGGNNTELTGIGWGAGMTGSWTLGMAMKSSSTGAVFALMGAVTVVGCTVSFNRNASGTNVSGTITFGFDTTAANANLLSVASTGWNDGTPNLIFVEYDSGADTLSLWVNGTKVGTRARAGTKPTMTGNVYLLQANPFAGLQVDEALLFNKVLTSVEHAALASCV